MPEPTKDPQTAADIAAADKATISANATVDPAGNDITRMLGKQGVAPGGLSASSQAATPSSYTAVDTAVEPANAPTSDGQGGVVSAGAQLEPALFVSNGSLDHGHIASNTGPVPIASVTDSPEEAAQISRINRARLIGELRGPDKLSQEQVAKTNALELEALAHDRGYELGKGGLNLKKRKFLELQEKDPQLGMDAMHPDADLVAANTGVIPRQVGGITVAAPDILRSTDGKPAA